MHGYNNETAFVFDRQKWIIKTESQYNTWHVLVSINVIYIYIFNTLDNVTAAFAFQVTAAFALQVIIIPL